MSRDPVRQWGLNDLPVTWASVWQFRQSQSVDYQFVIRYRVERFGLAAWPKFNGQSIGTIRQEALFEAVPW